ncbi:hypothetical protein L7F22_015287 [Adiantum nelumboides]|nr:hypothetical protein [Adiantum nelumboides]
MVSSHDSSLYNIKKLDGTNFPLWKKQIWHVLVQKKQLKPIKLKGIKPEDMDEDEWNAMDELALSAIMLTLAKSVYFNVADKVSAYDAWTKLSGLYKKQSASSQVYWLKNLVNLKMKEGTPMSNHLNEFITIYSQLSAQGVRTWKAKKGKEKTEEQGEKTKCTVKIQETNVTSVVAEGDNPLSGDIYFLKSTIDSLSLTATDGHALSDWIIHSRASLHVSPNRDWFTSYVSTKDHVWLGNE